MDCRHFACNVCANDDLICCLQCKRRGNEGEEKLKRPFREEDLKENYATQKREQFFETLGTSPKIDAVLKTLEFIKTSTGGLEKAIVFSQWTSALDILQHFLHRCGIEYRRVQGSMNSPHKANQLKEFKEDPQVLTPLNSQQILPTGSPFPDAWMNGCFTHVSTYWLYPQVSVILLSLMAAGVGIDIISANHVLFLDAWWNPNTEQQGIARANRLGQDKRVNVYRFVNEATIETRIYEVQVRTLLHYTPLVCKRRCPVSCLALWCLSVNPFSFHCATAEGEARIH